MKRVLTIALFTVVVAVPTAHSQVTADPSRISVKPRTAILELHAFNKMPDDDIEPVIKRLYKEMAYSGRYALIEREQVQNLVAQLGPDKSLCNDAACAAEIGRMLGVDKVVFGDVTKVEIIYELSLTVVDVASGTVERTHTEKVAGNMRDVASVGVLCAVQALHAEKKVSDYKKGDWRRIRAHGLGGRLNVVLPSLPDTVRQQIALRPTLGVGIHYDAMFRMKNDAEFHYTPNVEFWARQGSQSGSTMRLAEFAFNVADFRYLFNAPAEKNVVFYLGLGPTWVLDIIYDEFADRRWPPGETVYRYKGVTGGFAVNIMAGIEHMMQNRRWVFSVGFKAKLWDPSVFNLVVGLTRQLSLKEKNSDEKSTASAQSSAESDTTMPGTADPER